MPNTPHFSPDHQSLREALAELEHEQWCSWSHALAASENLSPERLRTWSKRWVPYAELSEADKDLDREYADRVLEILAGRGLIRGEAPADG